MDSKLIRGTSDCSRRDKMKKFVSVLLVVAVIFFANFSVNAIGSKGKTALKANISDISGRSDAAVIKEIVAKGIMLTVGGKFSPEKCVTRSEFVVILHKALGIKIMYFAAPDITKIFSDVKNTDAYADYLYDLVTTNIIDFRGQFKPKSIITREEMIHYLMNAYHYKMKGDENQKAPDVNNFNKFRDKNKISEKFINDVKEAASLGIAKAKNKNMFLPKAKATRADVAESLHGLLSAIPVKPSDIIVTPTYVKNASTFKMGLTINNKSLSNITINHTSGKKYDFVLLDSDKNEIYRWSKGMFFTLSLTKTTIEAGKSVTFEVSLDMAGNADLVAKAKYMRAYIAGQSSEFKVNADGYVVDIT